jgi:predicted nuclease of predicted toxin-antitoxin system
VRRTELIGLAASNGSVVLTFDLDCGDILAVGVLDKPGVVLFRLTDERSEALNRRLSVVLDERSLELQTGAIIVVEDERYRVRKLPIRPHGG